MRRVVALVLVEGTSLGALVAVHGPLVQASRPVARPDDLVVVGLWALAVATTAWLLVSTVAFLAVETLPAVPAHLHRCVAALTPRAIRVLVTRTVAFSALAVLASASTVAASEAGDGVRTGRQGESPPSSAPPTETTAPSSSPPSASRAGAGDTSEQAPAEPRRAAEHRVAPGENLWCIAAAHLREQRGGELPDHEIAPYWIRVVEENRSRLRSGDPDLVHPGEAITLPPI